MVKNSPTTKLNKKIRQTSKDSIEDQNEPETISSTTEIMSKKIQKTIKASSNSVASRRSRVPEPSDDEGSYSCPTHNSNVEFICKTCIKELCGYCILKHTEHIGNIVSIKEVMSDFLHKKESINRSPEKHFHYLKMINIESSQELEDIESKVKGTVEDFFDNLKEKIVQKHEFSVSLAENIREFQKNAGMAIESDSLNSHIKPELVKAYLNYNDRINENKTIFFDLSVSEESLVQEFKKALENNITFESYDSTKPNLPKYLHWFEWGKKKLNFFNIIENCTQVVDLDIHFKIPSFSRSIMIPSGKIFLLGGEEPEFVSRKEVYMYDTVAGDRKLYSKAPMTQKKFDFTLAHLDGYIYVICGKDSTSEVVDTCERYSIQDNVWENIASVHKKRYAASAVGISNGKIYLFGGRSDYNNSMVHEIEEYCARSNIWTILTVRNFNLWNPVEVCACIQITEDSILIFGGSDAQIKDSTSSLIFNFRDYSIEKMGELVKPQVFVNPPFLYKNHVYALGNEYYMKHRNLHRFSIEKKVWELIF